MLLGALFFHQGIHADKEALKYIGCAEAVLQGDLTDLTGNYLKYAGYVAFLLPFVAIGEPLLAVLAQVVLGIIAARALGRLTSRIAGSASLGHLSMALFLLCPLIQTWTLALYTEHFFLCMSVLFLERIERSDRKDPGVLFLGVVTMATRPVGMMFVVPALLWKWTTSSTTIIRNRMLVIGPMLLLIAAISIPRIGSPQLEPIASGQVVAGVGGTDATGFDGRTILDLAEGLQLRRVRVMGAERIELSGFTDTMRERLSAFGLFHEIIAWKLRMFVPTDTSGPAVLERVLGRWPVERIGEREAA